MRFRNRLREDQGYSLIELLVVMTVFGVIAGIVMNAMVTGLQSSRKAQARVEALSDLTRGLERIARELRAADPLLFDYVTTCSALQTEVGAEIVRDRQVWQYNYYLAEENGVPVLREDIDIFELDGTDVSDTREGDGQFIVNTDNIGQGEPLVTYLDATGAEVDLTGLTEIDDCREKLATASQIQLTLVRSLPEQNPVTVDTTVNIRSTRWN